MYLRYFELKETPFAITPDPRFVFLSQQHREALAHLLFGVVQGGSGGFVQLTGEIGTGKTTLCRLLMAQLPDTVQVALVLNPMQTPDELLRTLCHEFGVALEPGQQAFDALTRHLLDAYTAGRRVVLIIDEAQHLPEASLEQIRLLTNLETASQKLLQIILLGQPELRDWLARSSLRQVAQRITARLHLQPLARDETAEYVMHRLRVAGRQRPLFTASALRRLHRRTRGYPRLINVVADRALLGAYAREATEVEARLVDEAADEVEGRTRRPIGLTALAASAAVLLGCATWWLWPAPRPAAETPVVTQQAPQPAAIPAWTELARARALVLQDLRLAPMDGSCRSPRALVWCVPIRASESGLRRLARPMLLRDAEGALAIDSGRALTFFSDTGQHTELPAAWLAANWRGAAELIVARPSQYSGETLSPGAEHALLPLIQRGLNRFDGRDQSLASLDAAALERIRLLQSTFGLHPDGLVGPDTMAVLAALAEVDAQALTSGEGEHGNP